jgi:hypothetical protein
MDNLHEYQVRFLNAEGALIEGVRVLAESLAIATDRAGVIAAEMGAANFYITAKADGNAAG